MWGVVRGCHAAFVSRHCWKSRGVVVPFRLAVVRLLDVMRCDGAGATVLLCVGLTACGRLVAGAPAGVMCPSSRLPSCPAFLECVLLCRVLYGPTSIQDCTTSASSASASWSTCASLVAFHGSLAGSAVALHHSHAALLVSMAPSLFLFVTSKLVSPSASPSLASSSSSSRSRQHRTHGVVSLPHSVSCPLVLHSIGIIASSKSSWCSRVIGFLGPLLCRRDGRCGDRACDAGALVFLAVSGSAGELGSAGWGAGTGRCTRMGAWWVCRCDGRLLISGLPGRGLPGRD